MIIGAIYFFLVAALPRTTTALPPLLQLGAQHQLGINSRPWNDKKVLCKWHLIFCLGKFHRHKLRYSPSCLRFSARTSGNGAEVSNRGPGCDTCCSRTPGTSAHDTGFEHRSPTLAWAEPPLLTRLACRSTPKPVRNYECKSISRRRKNARHQEQFSSTYYREHALRNARGLSEVLQGS